MKSKRLLLILLPSAVTVSLMLSPTTLLWLSVSLLAGLFAGGLALLIAGRIDTRRITSRPLLCLAALAMSLPVALSCAARFRAAWAYSSLMHRLVGAVFADFSSGLRVLSLLLGLLTLPFLCAVFAALLVTAAEVLRSVRFGLILRALFPAPSVSRALRLIGLMALKITAAALAGTLLLVAAFALPAERIDENVRRSAPTIAEEGRFPKLYSWFTSGLDNFTDSLILLEAADGTDAPLLERAMMVYRGKLSGKDPAQSLTAHYLEGSAFDAAVSYPRYWHGCLAAVRPLLSLMSYPALRILNGAVQALCAALLCILMVRRKRALILPYLIVYLMLAPTILARSLQFSACYYSFTAGCAALLLTDRAAIERRAAWIFLSIGVLTAYLDLLTYPIAAFGIPAALWLALCDAEPLESRLAGLIRNGFFWCVGFGGMWVSKWVLASLITGEHVIRNGADAVARRTSDLAADGAEKLSRFDVELMNYGAFLKTPAAVLLVVFVLVLAVKCVLRRRQSVTALGRSVLPLFLVSLAPLVWYAFAVNHSGIHTFFTNKACAVSFLALAFAAVRLTEEPSGSP